MLWSGASCAFHTRCRRVRRNVPSGARGVRTAALKNEATRGCDPGKENLTVSARPLLSTLSRVCSVIPNCTGRCVFCCMTAARGATREPRQTSPTRSFVRSHARSLLSIARLNIARSRVLAPSCSRTLPVTEASNRNR
jgi:hypothetical protein